MQKKTVMTGVVNLIVICLASWLIYSTLSRPTSRSLQPMSEGLLTIEFSDAGLGEWEALENELRVFYVEGDAGYSSFSPLLRLVEKRSLSKEETMDALAQVVVKLERIESRADVSELIGELNGLAAKVREKGVDAVFRIVLRKRE